MATAMPPMVEQFKEMVRREWTDDANVAAWSRWKTSIAVQTEAMTDAILVAAQISPGLRVLDLAGGTGELGCVIAEKVGPSGQVTETDLAPGMLAVAEEAARLRGLNNMTVRQADAHAL